MAKLILGIAGEMGSGKGIIAKHVMEQRGGGTHRFSTILRDILDRVHLEQSREKYPDPFHDIKKKFQRRYLGQSHAS